MPSSEALLTALGHAVDAGQHEDVERLTRRLVLSLRSRDVALAPAPSCAALVLLQRKRYVSLVQLLAEALLANGSRTVEVVHRYALALLDDNRVAAAEGLLGTLTSDERAGNAEVAGAVGRVHKQRYVLSGPAAGRRRTGDLASGVESYGRAYDEDPDTNLYHGVNAAALLARADRDGVRVPGHEAPGEEARRIAASVLATVETAAEPDLWALATAAEAALALGRVDDAVSWMARYVGSDADAFEFASTLRQLELVWRLDVASEPGQQLIPLLRSRLLQAEGGAFSVSPDEITPASLRRLDDLDAGLEKRVGVDYERVFGWDRFQPIGWLHAALTACRSVARVEDSWGEAYGTGFVLDGTAVGGDGWPRRVLLTNAHVVPEALALVDTYLTFRGLADDGPHSTASVRPLGEILWHSPKEEYDACFLALPDDLDELAAALEMRRRFPSLDSGAKPRAYIIGHPQGSPNVQVSLHDTRVLQVDDVFTHYRSPTEPGSSGSPVFDDRWRVIALHHGATSALPRGIGPANEGIRMDRLLTAVAQTVS